MGLDCTVFVEAKIDGVWTHLTAFSLKRDFELFTRLGYNDNERSNTTPPEEWSTVSKWLFREVGGGCPQTVDFETFRKLGEQRRLERPNQFDLRPGWAPEFAAGIVKVRRRL